VNKAVDFFCVGAQKAGTTSLHHMLAKHPEVILPRIKETHFFNDGHGEFHLGLDHYFSKYFGITHGSGVLGEIDPEYMFFPEVPARIAAAFPKAKLIFVLRDPVTRAYSHYLMTWRRGRETASFSEAIEAESRRLESADVEVRSDFSYVTRGRYADQIERFHQYFPREQMLFILSDDLKREPDKVLAAVQAFLGLTPVPYVAGRGDDANRAAAPRHWWLQRLVSRPNVAKRLARWLLPPPVKRFIWDTVEKYNRRPFVPPELGEDVTARLRALYADDLARLEVLIGRPLEAWRE
jgi:hypothetical protein